MTVASWLRPLKAARTRTAPRRTFRNLPRRRMLVERLEDRWVPTSPAAFLSGPTLGVTQQPLTYTLSVIDDPNFTEQTEYTFNIDWDHDNQIDETVIGVSGTQVTHAFPTEGAIDVQLSLPDQTQPTSFVVDVSWALVQSGDLLIGGSTGDNCTISESAQAGDLDVTVGWHSGTFAVPGAVHIFGDSFSFVTLNGRPDDSDELINSTDIEFNGRPIFAENLWYWVYNGLGGDDALTFRVDAYREVDFYGGDGQDEVNAHDVVGADWHFFPPDQTYFTEDFVELHVHGADDFRFFASGIEELIGSHGNDYFHFSSEVSFTGSIAGGAGHDAMDYSGLAGPLTFQVGTTSFPYVTEATGIDGIIGTQSDVDELIGGSGPNLWHMNPTCSGIVNDLTFENFEIMTGGAGFDRIVSGGGISAISNEWHFTGSNSGTLNRTVRTEEWISNTGGPPILIFIDTPYVTTFSSFENLTCGGYYDTVFFDPADEFDGDIDCGGYGSIDYSALAGPITVNLQSGQFPHISGSVVGPGIVVGTSSLDDEIIGPDADATWWLYRGSFYGPNFAFANFETLRCGSGDDLFQCTNLSGPGITQGLLDGGGGVNTFSLVGDPEDPVAIGIQIDLAARRITDSYARLLVNEFRNISAFDGTFSNYCGFSNTLISDNQNTTWTIGADGSGTRGDSAFYGFQNFVGGSGSDDFRINGGDVSVDGGEGSDTYSVTFGNLNGPVNINDTGTTGTDIDSLNVLGTDGDDWQEKTSGTVSWKPTGEQDYREFVYFAGVETGTLNAAAGNDTILDPDTANWTLLGGLGDDTIVITGAVGDVSVDAGPGSNTVVITMGELTGPVIVNGSEGSTNLVIVAPPGENELTLSSTELVSGSEIIQFNLGSTAAGITIDGSAGDNTLVLQGPPPAPLIPVDIEVASPDPSTIHGLVWLDFNNDGEVNFGEQAIAGVTITLSGFDDLGQCVFRVTQTDADGIYSFTDLRPSNAAGYTLTQSQPAGFLDGIDSLGTIDSVIVGSDAVNDAFSGIVLPAGKLAENYNFGERPANGGSVGAGQTATIGFWQNKHGQNLIKALNGGTTATQLGSWLAATFPNMYASLGGLTNTQVAAHYKMLFGRNGQSSPGGPPKVDAQIMATALAVYVTNQTLAGTTAVSYGFQVTQYGVGTATFNVGTNGAAFGVANGTFVSVMDLLLAVNARSSSGLLFDQNGDGVISPEEAGLRALANNVFSLINESGGI